MTYRQIGIICTCTCLCLFCLECDDSTAKICNEGHHLIAQLGYAVRETTLFLSSLCTWALAFLQRQLFCKRRYTFHDFEKLAVYEILKAFC